MNTIRRHSIAALLVLSFGCESERVTPCQKLVDAIVARAQSAMAAGEDDKKLQRALEAPPPSLWDVPRAESEFANTRAQYEKALGKAREAAASAGDNRAARVHATGAAVFALYDLRVVCSGER